MRPCHMYCVCVGVLYNVTCVLSYSSRVEGCRAFRTLTCMNGLMCDVNAGSVMWRVCLDLACGVRVKPCALCEYGERTSYSKSQSNESFSNKSSLRIMKTARKCSTRTKSIRCGNHPPSPHTHTPTLRPPLHPKFCVDLESGLRSMRIRLWR